MASLGTYYINAPTLIQATSVFTDAAMTIFAPDGWYSDGVTSRQLVSGVLLVSQTCPSCVLGCDSQLNNTSIDRGYFNINIDTGSSTGAVVIGLYPLNSIIGVKAEYDAVVYNKFSSNLSGSVTGNLTDPTYIGVPANDCGVSGTAYLISEYDFISGNFLYSGIKSFTVDPSSVDIIGTQLYERYVFAVPKPTSSTNNIMLTLSAPCSVLDELKWYIRAYCAAPLPSVQLTDKRLTSAAACALEVDRLGYRVPSNEVFDSVVQMYDTMYDDENAVSRMSSGFYKINHPTYDWMELNGLGIVVDLGNC